MRLLWLKLAYSIEIGAYLAYIGHYKKSKDYKVYVIAMEELKHMVIINKILKHNGAVNSKIFNFIFLVLGHIIQKICNISNIGMLNNIAMMLEFINVINYRFLSTLFPEHEKELLMMGDMEDKHREYFNQC